MHEIALTLALAMGLSGSAEAGRLSRPSAAGAQIDAGTHAILELEAPVTTRTARVGDPVQLRTAGPILIDGQWIPIGSPARGVVTHVQRPGRVRGRGSVEIGIASITRPDGRVVPLAGSSGPIEPVRRRVPSPWVAAPAPPVFPILAGMTAGYATAALVSHVSNSEDTIVNSGAVVGLATGVLVGVLKRGDDLVLYPGATIEIVLENPAPRIR